MRTPTVHLNGTSREDPQRQYHDAVLAVSTAIDTLAKAAPNGRDYYLQEGDAYGEAFAEHNARMQALASVYRELHNLYNSTLKET